MNIVTGCSGIDAIAYAATLLDIDVIGQIEIDKFCNQILELRYPGVKRPENVFDVRGDEFGAVDIFAFGDPCQPHSLAGKREGTADERYIWPELFRIIQTMRPTYVLNENVVGSVSNGVVRDKIVQLESEGYRARAYTVPACAVGAPHERERAIIMGYSERPERWQSEPRIYEPNGEDARRAETSSRVRKSSKYDPEGTLGNAEGPRNGRLPIQPREPRQANSDIDGANEGRIVAYTPGDGCGTRRTESEGQPRQLRTTRSGASYDEAMADAESLYAGHGNYGNGEVFCDSKEAKRHKIRPSKGRSAQPGLGGNVDGLSDWLHGPGGQEDGSGVFEAFEAIFTATLEQILWPAGYGAEQYDYEPPRVASGVKNRTNRLKALGNSIVPWQIIPFLLAIKLIEANY